MGLSAAINDCRRNRWWRLTIYTLAGVLTTMLTYAWNHWTLMLVEDGAFEWLCPDNCREDSLCEYPCLKQLNKQSALFSYISSADMICGLLAGTLLDHIGPRYTAFIGYIVFFSAYGSVGMLSEATQGWYPFSYTMIGLCTNLVSYPCFILTQIYPDSGALMSAIMTGSQMGASLVFPVMWTVWQSSFPEVELGKMLWGYLLAIGLPVALLYTASLPRSPRKLNIDLEMGKMRKLQKQNAHPENYVESPSKRRCKKFFGVEDNLIVPVVPIPTKYALRQLGEEVITLDYALFVVFYTLQSFVWNYFSSNMWVLLGEDIAIAYGWMTWLQLPIGLLMGVLCDATSDYIVGTAIVTLAGVTYLFKGFGMGKTGEWTDWVAAVTFLIGQSHFWATKFVFINKQFHFRNFGKLVGIISIVSGLFGYILDPINTSGRLDIFVPLFGASTVLLIAMFLFLWRRRANGKVEFIKRIGDKYDVYSTEVIDQNGAANAEDSSPSDDVDKPPALGGDTSSSDKN